MIGNPNKDDPRYINIDFEQLKDLCGIQCTKREVTAIFKCSDETLERRIKEKYDIGWTEYYEKHRGTGLVSLRRKQLEVALEGNPTLLIWLGKQFLDQKDKQEVDQTVSTIKIDRLEENL
jgi:hypothetical protein